MVENKKYKAGDILFDPLLGEIWTIKEYDPSYTKVFSGFAGFKKITFPGSYIVYTYGKPPKGKFITYKSECDLDKMVKTARPEMAKILYGSKR
jgi:hypothetical protein